MKKFLALIIILFAGLCSAQTVQTLTQTAGNGYTDSIAIMPDYYIAGLYTDSLNTPATAHMQLSFSRNGKGNWYHIPTSDADTSLYTLKIADSIYIPLTQTLVGSVVGTAEGNENGAVWFRLDSLTTQTYDKQYFIRQEVKR